ncbi:MAG: 50S ribosomal protein L4 [Saprospiraceae bacterium]|jgi:large subunit ribosomal protein L4|nr:50S ribosomal protein L4 [Saprospiraceae bacterium]MBL0295497.1 50S ribosomal protein L4 [Saprospiraceae bacterium]
MTAEVYNKQGEKTGRSLSLPAEIFGIEPSEHTVYLAVKQYLAHQRQGTHKAKERSEVSGSTRKLHKQKGTGGARKGDINSPTMVGGGRAFGPRPRTYGQKLNKKIKLLAKKSVLSDKAKTSKIFILEDFTFDTPKTKEFVGLLKNMSLLGNKNIIVTGELNRNVYLSGRNIPFQDITSVDSLNTYQILKAKNVLLFESALGKLSNTLA